MGLFCCQMSKLLLLKCCPSSRLVRPFLQYIVLKTLVFTALLICQIAVPQFLCGGTGTGLHSSLRSSIPTCSCPSICTHKSCSVGQVGGTYATTCTTGTSSPLRTLRSTLPTSLPSLTGLVWGEGTSPIPPPFLCFQQAGTREPPGGGWGACSPQAPSYTPTSWLDNGHSGLVRDASHPAVSVRSVASCSPSCTILSSHSSSFVWSIMVPNSLQTAALRAVPRPSAGFGFAEKDYF